MSIEVDITRTVKVGGATILSPTEIVFPDGCNQVPVAVKAGVANQPAALGWTLAKLQALVIVSTQPVTLGFNAVNAAQTVTVGGGPTGGTFTISGVFPSAWTTAGIPFNASAAQVASAAQAAIVALGGTGAGAVVTGSGGPMPGSVLLTFSGTLGGQALTTMTASATGLTGGSPTASVASTVTGVAPAQTIPMAANVPLVWTLQAGYNACPITPSVVSTVNLTNAGTSAATVTFVVGANV